MVTSDMPRARHRQNVFQPIWRGRLSAFAALAGFIALVSVPALSAAEQTKLRVTARVAAFFRVQIDYQAPGLLVTQRDVGLGYVEAPAASRFSVTTNSREAYLIDFHPAGEWFRAVEVDGLNGPVELGADGGTIVHGAPALRSTPHQLSYRFYLRPDVQPGGYRWPLVLSVRPL
jgi:hypothetical protein